MPAAPAESASAVQNSATGAPAAEAAGAPLPPPPSMGKQMAQLVIIPAVIAMIAVALFWLFGSLASTSDSMVDQLARIRRNANYTGESLAGAQDPRYRDGLLAAYQLVATIEKLKTDADRKVLSDHLVLILKDNVNPKNTELQYCLLMALGRLAQPGGLEAVLTRADSPHVRVRVAVVGAILDWSARDAQGARAALPVLIGMLDDSHEQVRTPAAAAMSRLARPTDTEVIAPLKEAMGSIGVDPDGRVFQTTVNHAAIALALLNDPQGSAYVADVLLDRKALAALRADMSGKTDATMLANEQDHVIAGTLLYVGRMPDERVWSKVRELADHDPNVSIRKAALQLLAERKAGPEAK